MEKYCVSYFSIVSDDFLLHRYRIRKHNRLISTPEPRTGFMKNTTVTDVHQRVQLRSNLTNPYVKFFSFKRSIPNPCLHLFPRIATACSTSLNKHKMVFVQFPLCLILRLDTATTLMVLVSQVACTRLVFCVRQDSPDHQGITSCHHILIISVTRENNKERKTIRVPLDPYASYLG